MATFPTIYLHGTLAHQPQVDAYKKRIAMDPTIRSPKDAGYVKTRARFTRYPKMFDIVFRAVDTANKNTIEDFEEARSIGAESFSWTDPEGDAYTVRFASIVDYDPWQPTNFTRWTITFSLEEV